MQPLQMRLYSAQQGHQALQDMWTHAKAHLIAGRKLVVTLKPETRSLDQNAKFHAMCEDFARSRVQWAGKPRTAAEWKVLLVSGHAMATKEGAEMVPGLEGEFVNLRESTARMTKARSASLIEYAQALGAQMGVRFTAPEREYA